MIAASSSAALSCLRWMAELSAARSCLKVQPSTNTNSALATSPAVSLSSKASGVIPLRAS